MKYFIGLLIILFSFAFWFYQKNQKELNEVTLDQEVKSKVTNPKSNLLGKKRTELNNRNEHSNNLHKIENTESANAENTASGVESNSGPIDYPIEVVEDENNLDVGPNEIYNGGEVAAVVDDPNDRTPANE